MTHVIKNVTQYTKREEKMYSFSESCRAFGINWGINVLFSTHSTEGKTDRYVKIYLLAAGDK